MKRIFLLIWCKALFITLSAGCENNSKIEHLKENADAVIGCTKDEIQRKFGEPDGILSGFYGDVYRFENGAEIIVYYDGDGIAEQVKSSK